MAEASLSQRLLTSRISGNALQAAARVLRAGPIARMVSRASMEQIGVGALAALPARGEIPLSVEPSWARRPREAPQIRDERLGPLPVRPWPISAAALRRAYEGGATDPAAVVARVLAAPAGPGSAVSGLAPGAQEAAAEAAARLRAGQARSRLDGVPVGIKEEAAIAGLPLRLGTRFISGEPAREDATVVRRLREAGAIVAVQTPMTEYGVSPFGVSAQQRLPQNPHAPGHSAGGSSTGSGVAVASGLVPLALGGDGGGSIRIPASLCGVFGLKPTFGRVSRVGDPFGGTLDHLGPLGASMEDVADFLCVVAGPDPLDPATTWAPADLVADRAAWQGAIGRGVRGLRIGVPDRLWARCDAEVAQHGTAALDLLCAEGAQRVPLALPLSAHAPAIGFLTFGGEVLAMLRGVPWDDRMGADLRIALQLLRELPPDAYLDAQRLRQGLRQELRQAFEGVDLIALPTTAVAAPPISEVEREGLMDLEAMEGLVRFTFLGNLTGLPALSAPVGMTMAGARRPVGLQLIGDAWDEATVLAAGAHLQRIGAAELARPQGAIELL